VPGGKYDRRWANSSIVAVRAGFPLRAIMALQTSARVRRVPPPRRDGPAPREPTGPVNRHVNENLAFNENETERGKARESILHWQKEVIALARGVASAAEGV